jgi:FMN hydrolase / 5-amino-6-(5-phospho-D-ribitylamino)uracil phosphatase
MAARGCAVTLRAVLFDVDFTLAKPGPELGPEGYRRRGEQFGLRLDPARYDEARAAAVEALERHPELMHDEEIWVEFTERIVRGMGGDGERARECAVAIEQAWEEHGNFDLYEDVLPVLERLRGAGLKLGLVSNGVRDLDDFVVHHALDVDVAVCSRAHGRIKPHETIFRAALERLGVGPAEAVMVGDSLDDDVEGAQALGMRALLVDRENRYPEVQGRLPNLYALPAALELEVV